MKRRMEDQWQAFSRAVVPPGAHETQYVEMRKAFMAGAFSVLTLIMADSDPGIEPTAADDAMMEEIMAELMGEMAAAMQTAPGSPTAN